MTFQRKPVTLVLTLDEAIIHRDLLFNAIPHETEEAKLALLHQQYALLSNKINKVIQARERGDITFDPAGNSGSR